MNPKFNLKQLIKKGLNNATITNVIIVGVITLLAKGLGFFKEIVIADSFGLSELLDTFYIAILIPGFMSNVFLDGFKSVFVPNYIIELRSNKDIGAFQSTCFLVTLGVALLFGLIATLFTDVYLETFFSGHTPAYYALIKTQFYYLIPCLLFWGLSSMINGLLTIDDEFTFSSMSIIFTPIAIITCVYFFKEELGSLVLAIGTLIGSFLNFLFLLIVALRRKIIHLKKPDFLSKNIKEVFKQLPAKLSANILTGANSIVDQYFGAQLIIGSIAALNYGVKIPMFAIGIITLALGNVLLPYFSKKVAENRERAFIELQRILKFLVIGSGSIALILVLLSTPLITLIFERNAFTSDDTIIVSKIQQLYLLQIPAYIVTIIMVRFLESINKNSYMAFAAVFCLILNIVLNFIFSKTMGVYGLALATSIVAVINSFILYFYIRHLNKNQTKFFNT
ncbi:murein biosynthesis integral membrane protein MurJ [Psychroserpens ponticola]|uniref:Polysaccharide biosynthesis C-terminal domain-containing protein n=1 Tax=Psychroserpens ponticola TaxID=2932268 RepID=A0ABY7S1A0_9FLAO|nr:lipid II flippase MurJ [Psychroserpens ponticola]WCO03102.1 polysaccharide biosynthesis C-terminal domain-containing protein [Psychroserpens ponticola]